MNIDSIMEKYIEELATNGFTKIPNVFDRADTDEALRLIKIWEQKTKDSLSDNIPFLNRESPMVYNLQNKEYFFLKIVLQQPAIEKLLMHFLNDKWFRQIPKDRPNYILRSYLGRSSSKPLPLHIDSFVPYLGNYVYSLQVLVPLEDQTKENGCTLFVPGSHKVGEYVEQTALKDAIPVESKVGDVVIFDSRTWHGTGENTTSGTRWSIISTYTRWWVKQAFDIPKNLPQAIYDQLTDSEKAVLGFCSIPYDNETIGIDMKRGYESLLEKVTDYK